MLWLMLLFAVLAVIFGFWAFAAAVWIGVKILFWVFVALFVVSLFSAMFRPVP